MAEKAEQEITKKILREVSVSDSASGGDNVEDETERTVVITREEFFAYLAASSETLQDYYNKLSERLADIKGELELLGQAAGSVLRVEDSGLRLRFANTDGVYGFSAKTKGQFEFQQRAGNNKSE